MGAHQRTRGWQFSFSEEALHQRILDTYRHARQVRGRRGRQAFQDACEVYAAFRPGVPNHLVPKRVAGILNPELNL